MYIEATVNEVTREIKWDKSQVAAVDGDYAVNGFKLTCLGLDPDYNLTTGTWYAVLTGTDGTSHSNPLTVSGGVVTWEFDNNINKGGSGVVKFFLYAVTADKTGKITKRWDSAITDLRVAGTIDYENQEEEAARESEIDRLAGLVTTLTATAATINDVKAVISRITNSSPVVVAAVADLSGLDTTKYQLAIVRADGYLYYYDGTAWQKGIKYGSYELDTTLTESGKAADAAAVGAKISQIKEDLNDAEDRITALEQSGAGISATARSLLITILGECVTGTDQTSNITLLNNALANIPPVSISAVLNGTALEGQSYSELSFTVTATFDDESTQTVANYTIVTTGTVAAGSNTVTIRYRGLTTTCTFTASTATTYTITNNLTNVTSSNATTVVVEDSYYSATLTEAEGYEFASCTVTMGGVDVTSTVYSNQEILITEVTGDVVITASATQIVTIDDFVYKNSSTRILEYSDDGTTLVRTVTRVLGTVYGKHEVSAATEVTVTITNNTERAISTGLLHVGELAPYGTYEGYWAPTKLSLAMFNCRQISNSSGLLEAGASISLDYTISANGRLAIETLAGADSLLTISVTSGTYNDNMVDATAGYTLATLASGTYDVIDFYTGSDNTTTALAMNVEAPTELGTYELNTGNEYKLVLMTSEEGKYTQPCYIGFTEVPGTSSTRQNMEAFNSIRIGGSDKNGPISDLIPYVPVLATITSISGYYLITDENNSIYFKEAE